MTSKEASSQCFEHFFSMPQELRELVYRHVYTGLILHSKKSPVDSDCLTALLRASKMIYREAKPILYATAIWKGDYVLKTLLWPHQYTRPRTILDDRDLTPIQNVTIDAGVPLDFLRSRRRLTFPPARMPNIRKVVVEFCMDVRDARWSIGGGGPRRTLLPLRRQGIYVDDEWQESFKSRGNSVWSLIQKALDIHFDDLQTCLVWVRQDHTYNVYVEISLRIFHRQICELIYSKQSVNIIDEGQRNGNLVKEYLEDRRALI